MESGLNSAGVTGKIPANLTGFNLSWFCARKFWLNSSMKKKTTAKCKKQKPSLVPYFGFIQYLFSFVQHPSGFFAFLFVGYHLSLFMVLACCVFSDGLLRTLVVTSGYLNSCFLSVILNQSGNFPLTSAINKALSLRELLLDIFFFSDYSL